MIENGVIDWDCAGLSHYYGWHELEIKEAAREVLRLKRTISKDVMIVETAWP